MKLARVIIINAKAPAYLWPFTIETMVYIVVRLIPKGKTKSPLQYYCEVLKIPNPLPSIKHLQVWFCKAYMHIPQEDYIKLLKTLSCTKISQLIGYKGNYGHIFKIWYPKTSKIIRSRDVTF
jgi:hypothetical protein